MTQTILHIRACEYDTGNFEVTRPITDEEIELIRPLIKAISDLGHERYNFSTRRDSTWDAENKRYIYFPEMYNKFSWIDKKAIDFMVKDVFKGVAIDGIISINLWKVEVLEENHFLDWYDME